MNAVFRPLVQRHRGRLHQPSCRPFVTKVSSIFKPSTLLKETVARSSKDVHSVSQQLLLELGFIRPSAPGTFCVLPLAQRSLQKIVNIIDTELSKIGCQKLSLPALAPAGLWEKSGRLKTMEAELFKVRDRHGQRYVLSPTHEEVVADLLASTGHISHRQLPLKLYQVSTKFRDEMKPRSGLLRAREFLMKDLYTFDASLDEADKSYQLVRHAYQGIFDALHVPYVAVDGDSGSMGGLRSEEFHFLAEVGEDHLSICSGCGRGVNAELKVESRECPALGKCEFVQKRGIEVGHCFVLGTRYSEPLKAVFTNNEGKNEPMVMGCHGLGVSRILAAAAECLSTPEELRLPLSIAPYKVCIIPPKEGSKEADASELAQKLGNALSSIQGLEGEVVEDDRTALTIGRRCKDASRLGYPVIVVAGRTAACATPTFELFLTAGSGEKKVLSFEQTVELIKDTCVT
ncbi:probable proline--tRNA ligase, mitochondrial [Neocloeon triangulifer]|uniref:probable proline--tRNA ligase, mitochondrial n=1 Tax=Neocloeon triangulifer TaxID=2078957 RepID=UPI00286F61C6|nr:probable proline--tRNA ligase, mitochondrial [Neocloeon triangulifer]